MDLKQEAGSAESDSSIVDIGQIYEVDSCQKMEEVEDHQSKIRFKRERITFTSQQLEILEELFKKSGYPDVSEIGVMKEKTQLSESKLVVWFKNRRAKARRQIRDLDEQMPSKESPSVGTSIFVNVNKDNPASMRKPARKKLKKPPTKLKNQTTSGHVPHSVPGSSSSVPRFSSQVPESSSDPNYQPRSQQPIQFTYHQLPTDQDITEAAAVTVSAQFKPILLKILMQAPD